MQQDTAIGGAFERAGINTPESRLRQHALAALKKTHNNIERALKPFAEAVAKDQAALKHVLAPVLKAFAEDISGAGQSTNGAQEPFARAGERSNIPGQDSHASNGQMGVAGKNEGTGYVTRGTQTYRASPPRSQSVSDRNAAISVRRAIAVTIFDTFKVRDGRGIGDVRFGELERLRATDAMGAALIRQIQKRFAFAPHDTKVRDLVNEAELQQMIQKAAEIADAT